MQHRKAQTTAMPHYMLILERRKSLGVRSEEYFLECEPHQVEREVKRLKNALVAAPGSGAAVSVRQLVRL